MEQQDTAISKHNTAWYDIVMGAIADVKLRGVSLRQAALKRGIGDSTVRLWVDAFDRHFKIANTKDANTEIFLRNKIAQLERELISTRSSQNEMSEYDKLMMALGAIKRDEILSLYKK